MKMTNAPQMTKEEAEKMLAGVIHQLKLTTQERNTLLFAIHTLKGESVAKAVENPKKIIPKPIKEVSQ